MDDSITISTGHTEKVNCVQFCPTNENLILSAGKDKSLRMFIFPRELICSVDIRTFDTVMILKGHNTEVTTASFVPCDGSLVVSCDYGGNINYWSTQY